MEQHSPGSSTANVGTVGRSQSAPSTVSYQNNTYGPVSGYFVPDPYAPPLPTPSPSFARQRTESNPSPLRRNVSNSGSDLPLTERRQSVVPAQEQAPTPFDDLRSPSSETALGSDAEMITGSKRDTLTLPIRMPVPSVWVNAETLDGPASPTSSIGSLGYETASPSLEGGTRAKELGRRRSRRTGEDSDADTTVRGRASTITRSLEDGTAYAR